MLNKCIEKELHNSEIFAQLIQNPEYAELGDETNAVILLLLKTCICQFLCNQYHVSI